MLSSKYSYAVGASCDSTHINHVGNSKPSLIVSGGLYRNPLKTLRRVSGRLSRLFKANTEQLQEKPTNIDLLIIDDEESICLSMREYFTQHGFNVDTALEIQDAENLILKKRYGVIIQDLRLGINQQPDGLDIIKLVHERHPQTRIVVLTAYGSTDLEEEVRRSGVDAFLHKPKPLSQVAQVIHGLIELRQSRVAPT
jgi:ActR/RegA family two-component response regulator